MYFFRSLVFWPAVASPICTTPNAKCRNVSEEQERTPKCTAAAIQARLAYPFKDVRRFGKGTTILFVKGTPSLKLLVDFGVWFPRWIFWCIFSWIFSWTFRAIFLGKTSRKNPPNKTTKNPRLSRKLFDQNPLKEISTLIVCTNSLGNISGGHGCLRKWTSAPKPRTS